MLAEVFSLVGAGGQANTQFVQETKPYWQLCHEFHELYAVTYVLKAAHAAGFDSLSLFLS